MNPRLTTPSKQTVAVGMSGGVDSTLAACLLHQQGYDVLGITMQIWDGSASIPAAERSGCFGPNEAQEIEKLQALCARLEIPHHVIPLAAEYKQYVLDYFRREYLAGRTPNPCLACNRRVKFGFLVERARQLGLTFDCFATGHYARVEFDAARRRFLLKRGLDTAKDQSYFLAYLTQDQLKALIFPLGALAKSQVKARARELGLAQLADQKESQDFIACRNYSALFKPEDIRPGPLLDRHGRVLGQHRGIVFYTVGQRKGLGLSGTKQPLYVVRIDAPTNTVVVGIYDDLFSDRLRATDINWIALDALREPLRVKAKIRQQHPGADALVTPDPATNSADVKFNQPQMSITPGQTVVFYQADAVLGGGTIA